MQHKIFVPCWHCKTQSDENQVDRNWAYYKLWFGRTSITIWPFQTLYMVHITTITDKDKRVQHVWGSALSQPPPSTTLHTQDTFSEIYIKISHYYF